MPMKAEDFYTRRAGVLLHPTSLPSGVLDTDAERWLELLATAGFSVWQVLPLGEPQSGLSPYTCTSAFAMNPALLREFPAADFSAPRYRAFCAANHWLRDYATFKLLQQQLGPAPWYQWPDRYRYRDTDALEQLRREHAQEFLTLLWQQYVLHDRWRELRRLANSKGILLFGDMPLFVAHDSADVWANPDQFRLDEDGLLSVVAGVPPDYYSETGQRWGNPHYNWDVMKASGFGWWKQRMQYHLDLFDLVRIDHFRGLEAAWVIDAGCKTAVDGHWEKMPGAELLAAIRHDLGMLPVIAEDLGIITPEVTALRKQFQLPGMSVMQFGFDAFEDNPHKPRNIEPDRVVYTGTHDNDTTRGWFEALTPETRQHVLQVLGIDASQEHHGGLSCQVVHAMTSQAMHSRASLCILPLQDILCLGSAARMNTPGTTSNNWQWTFQWSQLENHEVTTMRRLIEQSSRLVSPHD